MPEDMRKLDIFIKTVMSDARSESEAILAAVDTDRSEAMSEAEKEYRAEADSYIQGELARAQSESGKAISRKLLDNKRALYQYRRKLAEELTEEVKRRLGEYTLTPDYGKRLEKLLRAALDRFGGAPVKVYLRPSDTGWTEQMRAAFPEADLTFEEGGFVLGGMICECAGLRLRADLTFDARLDEISARYSELFEFDI